MAVSNQLGCSRGWLGGKKGEEGVIRLKRTHTHHEHHFRAPSDSDPRASLPKENGGSRSKNLLMGGGNSGS